MSALVVTGLDLSLTSCGLARITIPDGNTTTWNRTSTGKTDDSLEERADRLINLASYIVEDAFLSDLVVIEGPSFGQGRQSGTHDRAGLWWLVVSRLKVPVVEVSPAQVKKYATGNGAAKKDAVLASVVRRYSWVDVENNDMADALVLAAMGARHLGHPIEQRQLSEPALSAMEKVRWP